MTPIKRSNAVTLAAIDTDAVERIECAPIGFSTVTGGGLVPGTVVLLGGEPGVGKSTLLLQLADSLDCSALYASGEESLEQIALRAIRMNIAAPSTQLIADSHVEEILREARLHKAQVLIVDSIQTMRTDTSNSAAGSVTQVRESARILIEYARQHTCCVILVAHINKKKAIAGPKTLEHMVDAVLMLREKNKRRILSASKNRYGATDQEAVFEMTEGGLRE